MNSPVPKLRASIHRHKGGISLVMSTCDVSRRQARQAFDDAMVQLMTTKRETDHPPHHWEVAILAISKLTQAMFLRAVVEEGLITKAYAKKITPCLFQTAWGLCQATGNPPNKASPEA